jgi:protein-tyrosine phosphatase
MTIGVLFVCTGNICRSPMAKGVFHALVRNAGLSDAFMIDSAGTYEGHVGKPASLLAIEAARLRGYEIADHRARLLTNEDLERFEHPMAMDRTHLAAMRWMAPRKLQDRPQMLMRCAPELNVIDIPDPYGGPAGGYGRALDLIEAGCRGLFAKLEPLARTAI